MKITIIGAAGNVGSAVAFDLASHSMAEELVLIDTYSQDKLVQYAYDMESSISRRDMRVTAGKYEEMAGSDIVFISAGSANVVASRQEVLRPNLPLIHTFASNIKRYCPGAIVITSTNPVDPLNYAMYRFSGFDRHKCIGYAANDSIRFMMFVAQALGIRSNQVEAWVIGEHGNSEVPLFSSIKIDGKPYQVTPEIKQKIKEQIASLPSVMEGLRMKTGRTSAWTTALGIEVACRAIIHDQRIVRPCSVPLDGEYGCRNMSMSVPVVLGKDGVQEIQEWKLDPEEWIELQNSIDTLNPAMQYVDEFIKMSN
jgi:malate dehydrogenase